MTTQIKQIIAETRRLEKAASVGPWHCDFTRGGAGGAKCHSEEIRSDLFKNEDGFWIRDVIAQRPFHHVGESSAIKNVAIKNGDFIVYARNNITAILDYVAELEQRIKFLEETDLRHLD